jgi:hypothetical protein
MNAIITFATIFFSLTVLLFVAVMFFSFLKYLKRTYFPGWKFPDYVSVGYAEYLYRKFIKRTAE